MDGAHCVSVAGIHLLCASLCDENWNACTDWAFLNSLTGKIGGAKGVRLLTQQE